MPLVDQLVKFRPLQAVFDAYLSSAPLAHALFRTAEAEHLGQVPLLAPVLDLGCGCGEFAAAALDGVIDVGVDIAARPLARARRTRRYRDCRLADARGLPFDDGQFQTVLSVSVLEHIREPEAVLAEAFRVLAPGGTFVATIVLEPAPALVLAGASAPAVAALAWRVLLLAARQGVWPLQPGQPAGVGNTAGRGRLSHCRQ